MPSSRIASTPAYESAPDMLEIDDTHVSTQRDPRAIRSGRALGSALLGLLETRPFEQITIREIVAAAGVHYTTFFRHHPTKEALLDHVAAEQIDELVALTLPILDSSNSRAAVDALFGYVAEHRALWTALLTGGAAPAMRAELLRVSRAVAAERAPGDDGLPVELAVAYTTGLMIDTLTWWLSRPVEGGDVDMLAATLHRLLTSIRTTF